MLTLLHLFDFGNIADKSLVVDKVAETLQLIQVTDEVLTNSLIRNKIHLKKNQNNLQRFEVIIYHKYVVAVFTELQLTSAMTSASPGLHMTSQRRGVMPLVLFWNL